MDTKPLHAHSRMEVSLYLGVTPCENCGHGPLAPADPASLSGDYTFDTLAIRCGACGFASTLPVKVPAGPDALAHDVAVVNSSPEPSHLLDVGQWIVLHAMLTETGKRAEDKVRGRHLALQAAQCLEEAIKFYEDDENDLPPSEAFSCDASRERFRDAPAQFSRRRLQGLRAKLPSYPVGDA